MKFIFLDGSDVNIKKSGQTRVLAGNLWRSERRLSKPGNAFRRDQEGGLNCLFCGRNISHGLISAFSKEMLFHLRGQILTSPGIGQIQAVFID